MFDQMKAIAELIVESFVHMWPYLLVTIPLAVVVQMSGASKYISRAFNARPILAIVLATAVGAFSPLCSCGVVPVVAALLISGVPLAPVMSFWVASPSMDPEIFFLSAATIGWELAVWRLAGTFAISLAAGMATHYVEQRGWLGSRVLRSRETAAEGGVWRRLRAVWRRVKDGLRTLPSAGYASGGVALVRAAACCSSAEAGSTGGRQIAMVAVPGTVSDSGAASEPRERVGHGAAEGESCGSREESSCSVQSDAFWRRLLRETWDATWMVARFMLLAFLLSALIKLYVPAEWVASVLGHDNPLAIPTAALLGVPAYVGNLTALPMISGLLAQGMSGSASLAFLISGPTTTLPAMAAVWGLASRRVFALYVSYSLVGAVVLGYVHSLVTGLF